MPRVVKQAVRTSAGRTVVVGNAPVENAPVVRSGGRLRHPVVNLINHTACIREQSKGVNVDMGSPTFNLF